MVIDRGAFLSGRYLRGLRRDRRRQGGLRRRRHLKVILETGELVTYDNVRRASWLAMLAGARLHQDLDRQDRAGRDAAGHAGDARGGARLPRRHRPPGRRQAGRRHPHDARTRSSTSSWSTRPPATTGSTRTGSASAPPACSTTCCCSGTKLAHRPLLRPRLRHARLSDGDPMPSRSSTPRRPSRARSSTSSRPTACSSTASSSTPTDGQRVQDGQPGDRGGARRGRRGRRRPTSTGAVAAARRAYDTRLVARCPARERGKYLFRIARHPAGARPRARRARVARQRQADPGVPRRRRPAGRRRTSSTTPAGPTSSSTPGFGPDPRPLGVAGQVIPWNFPLLMLAWKIAPALASGNTVVLKPAETTPLTALLFAEICQQADLPPGVVNIVTGAGETGRALVEHPGVDKVAFTGSTEVGKAIARTVAGTRKKVTLELGGKAANIVFDDAPIDQAVEGIVNGIFFNQGHVCCAGSRLLVQEIVARRGARRAASAGSATLRVGDPLDKNTDIGAINSAEQLARIRELSDVGEAEGAERWSPPCELPDRGFWFPPTVFTGVSPGAPDRPRGDLRPGAVGADLPHAGRGGREGQQHAVRPVGRRLDREGLAHPLDGRPAARRRGVGQHVQPVRPDVARSAATRSRATAARAAGTGWRPTSMSEPSGSREHRARRAQDLQALHRRRVPALGVRPLLRGDRRRRASSSPTPRRPRARTPATPSSPPARRSPAGPARRRTTAARCSTAWPSCWRAGAAQFVDEVAAGEGLSPAQGRRPPSTRPSTAGSGTPAGPTRSRRSPASANPVAGPYFDFSVPEPTGVVAVLAPQESSLLGLVSACSRRSLVTGNTRGRAGAASRAAAGGHARRGAGDLRRARRRGQRAHRPHRRGRAVAGRRTSTSTRSTSPARRPTQRRASSRSPRPTTSSGCSAPSREPTGRADPGPRADAGVPRDQDRLAPDRRLTAARPRGSARHRPAGRRRRCCRRTSRSARCAHRR